MATNPRDADSQAAPADNATAPAPKYQKPVLTEYGPLAKITQGSAGSTGESGNFAMRMCL
jgi:hypothetical protein